RLPEDAVLRADLPECLDASIEVILLMGRRKLSADARLSLRHDREEEADHVDSFRVEIARHVRRELRVVEHDRDNRAVALLQVEADSLEPISPIAGVP